MFDLDAFAEKIAIQMKSINNEKTASIEVMKYGLLIFINLFTIVTASSLIGWITGKLLETILVLAVFALLRACTGGYHLKSSIHCMIFSTLIIVVIPHIPMNHKIIFITMILSMIIIAIFAPSGIENQTNFPKRYYPFLKGFALLLVASNAFFLSSTLAACFIIQSLMLIRRIGGEKHEEIGSI